MDTIIIPTAQNIELEYPLAGLGDRILATFIDILILLGYVLLIAEVLDLFDFDDGYTPIMALVMLPAILYSFLCEVFLNGQTLGKKALKIRVVMVDGGKTSLSGYLVRWIIRSVDIWSFSGIVAIIAISVGKKGQRLGDIAADTTVVKLKLVTVFGDTMFVDTDVAYKIQYPQIKRLSDRDMSILKEVLDAGLRSNNPDLLGRLASKVREVTQIPPQANLSDTQFLKVVLADYNHLYKGGK